MTRVRRLLGRPLGIGVLLVTVAAAGFGLYWFQPWKLWQDQTVDEALPTAQATPDPTEEQQPAGPEAAGTEPSGAPSSPAGPRTLADGELISHEHATSGTVKLVRLDDGSHVVRLENLDTSNGPDLRVWLTDAPVKEGRAGWHVFDDGEYVSLGKLKGNKGSQNYAVPEDVDEPLDAAGAGELLTAAPPGAPGPYDSQFARGVRGLRRGRGRAPRGAGGGPGGRPPVAPRARASGGGRYGAGVAPTEADAARSAPPRPGRPPAAPRTPPCAATPPRPRRVGCRGRPGPPRRRCSGPR